MWYNRITNSVSKDDFSEIPTLLEYYESEIASAKKDVAIRGVVERNLADLPGVTEHRFNQLQEIESVLTYLNIQLRRIRRKYFQQYLEHYNRALTSRDAEKYVDGEQEVVDFECIINSVALVRNEYLGVMKGLECKNYMIGHIVKLRTAGMEDISI